MKNSRHLGMLSILAVMLLLSASRLSHAQTSPTLEVLGMKAQHFLRSSYFLEATNAGECRPFVLKEHTAENDLDNIITNIPTEERKLLAPSSDMVTSTKVQAYQEVERMRREIQSTSTGLDFRCGVLLGIASTIYYQSRGSWSEVTRQSKPVWVLP